MLAQKVPHLVCHTLLTIRKRDSVLEEHGTPAWRSIHTCHVPTRLLVWNILHVAQHSDSKPTKPTVPLVSIDMTAIPDRRYIEDYKSAGGVDRKTLFLKNALQVQLMSASKFPKAAPSGVCAEPVRRNVYIE